MKGELDIMSQHLSLAEDGGPVGESVRMLLQEKHLGIPARFSPDARPRNRPVKGAE